MSATSPKWSLGQTRTSSKTDPIVELGRDGPSQVAAVGPSGAVPSSAMRCPRQRVGLMGMPEGQPAREEQPASGCAPGRMMSTRSNRTCLCFGLAAKRISLISVSSVQPGPASSSGHRSATPGSSATVSFSAEHEQRLKSPISTATSGSNGGDRCGRSRSGDQGAFFSAGKIASSCAFRVEACGPVLSRCTVARRSRHPERTVTSVYRQLLPIQLGMLTTCAAGVEPGARRARRSHTVTS